MKIFKTLASAFFVLAGCGLWSCSSYEPLEGPVDIKPREGQLIVALDAPSTAGRTDDFESRINIQHVKSVEIYVFEGKDGDAVFRHQEPITWPDNSAGSTEDTERAKVLQYSDIKGNTAYTFVAVGLDDHSPSALSFDVEKDVTKLKEFIAKVTGTQADMAASEFFAGSTVATTSANGSGLVHIDMYRRVARIQGWFHGIPSGVTALQIELWKDQNASVGIVPVTGTDAATYYDYLSSPTIAESKVLARGEFADGAYSATITENPSAPVLSLGAYLLPLERPSEGTYTIKVSLYKGTTLVKSFTALDQNEIDAVTGDSHIFPIRANHYYSFGTDTTPLDIEIPSGDLIITHGPWQYSIDIPLD